PLVWSDVFAPQLLRRGASRPLSAPTTTNLSGCACKISDRRLGLGKCRFGDTDTGGLPSVGQRPERVGDCRGLDRGGGCGGCSCDGARDGYFSDIDVEFAEAFGEYAD